MKPPIYFLLFHVLHFASLQISIPCTKPNCVRAAGLILSNMDDSVSPCDDFYKFACGNFNEKNGLFNSIDTTTLESFNHRKDVRKLLDEVLLRDDPEMENLKLFHSSCINADLSHSNQVKEVLRVLNEIGDWPLINEDFDETQFDWVERSLKLNNFGLSKSAFFNLGINTEDFSLFFVEGLKIDFPILWDEFEFDLIDNLEEENLYTAYANFFKLYQRNVENDKLFTEALNLSEDIRNLKDCKLNHDRAFRIESLYNFSTQIDWLNFINDKYSPYNLTLNDFVLIENCTFRSMSGLFSLLNSTSKKSVATLMLMRVANELFNKIKFYTSEWLVPRQVFKIDRVDKCFETEVVFFSLHLFKLYHNKFISNETKSIVSRMMSILHFELQNNILFQGNWIADNTNMLLYYRVRRLLISFFLPPQSEFDELNDQISNLINLTGDNFVNNILELSKARSKLKLYKIQNSHMDYLFKMELYAENIKELSAHVQMNYIGASPSLFREPFFHPENPMALNYGSLGFMFGHELMHSINKYFIDLNTVATIDGESHQAFMKKTNCIVDKYSRFVDKELKTQYSGSRTLSEDLADVEGIRLAYKGYKIWLKYSENNFHLIGLNYTANQLFWISMANTLCRFDNTYTWKHFKNRSHSHHRFRVSGMVSNSPEFMSDFNCPLDSPMNHQPKCTIWMSN